MAQDLSAELQSRLDEFSRLADIGDSEGAISILQELGKVAPDNDWKAFFLVCIAQVLIGINKLAEAQDSLKQASAIPDLDPIAYTVSIPFWTGEILWLSEQYETLLDSTNQTLLNSAAIPEAHEEFLPLLMLRKAIALSALARFDEAITSLQSISVNDLPDNEKGLWYWHLARCQEALELPNEMAANYERAIDSGLQPAWELKARYSAAHFHAKRGAFARALGLLEKYEAEVPESRSVPARWVYIVLSNCYNGLRDPTRRNHFLALAKKAPRHSATPNFVSRLGRSIAHHFPWRK